MSSKSERELRLFRLVKSLKTGKRPFNEVSKSVRNIVRTISPKIDSDFTKVSKIVMNLKESEYSLSKFKKISGTSFSDLLRKNVGLPFDQKEILIFQSNQSGFGGFGKINFIFNKQYNQISTKLFSNSTTKKFVFKKLIDGDDKNVMVYGCFIKITYPDKSGSDISYILSSAFDNTHVSNKTKVLSDFIDRINSYGI